MIKSLLHTVRGAITWMTLGAILDGICGLLFVFVIINWSSDIAMPLTLLVIASIVALFISYIATQKGYLAGGLVMRYLANALIQHLPLSQKPVKGADHLIAGSVSQIMSVPAHLLHPIISGIVTPLTVVIGVFLVNLALGGLLLFVGLCLIFILRFCAKYTAQAEQQVHQSQQNVLQKLDSYAYHQPLIRRAGLTQQQLQPLKKALDSQYQTQKQHQRQSLPFHLLFSLSVQSIFIGVFYVGAMAVTGHISFNGSIFSLEMWLASLLLLARFIEPLWLLSHLESALRQSKASIEQVEQALVTEELTFLPVSSVPEDHSVSALHVSYDTDEHKTILRDINLHVKSNSFTAIVGPSGAGKSTLLSLLARQQDPSQGTVKYGEIQVDQLSQTVLCAKRGILMQHSQLFRGSLRSNLTLDMNNIDDREISIMLSSLNIDSDNASLCRDVGYGGMALSGGQRQRVCIARLLLSHPDIILMDEPTASLDTINTASVINLLVQAHQQTRIVVTHQPMLAKQAQHIVYMENGKIIDQGTHAELIERNDWYNQFIRNEISFASQISDG